MLGRMKGVRKTQKGCMRWRETRRIQPLPNEGGCLAMQAGQVMRRIGMDYLPK